MINSKKNLTSALHNIFVNSVDRNYEIIITTFNSFQLRLYFKLVNVRGWGVVKKLLESLSYLALTWKYMCKISLLQCKYLQFKFSADYVAL